METEASVRLHRPARVGFSANGYRVRRKSAYGMTREQAEAAGVGIDVEHALDRWGDMVLRLALCKTDNRADAEDIVQVVFMKLCQRMIDFDSDEHLKAWLLRVTLNSANDIRREAYNKNRAVVNDAEALLDQMIAAQDFGDGGAELSPFESSVTRAVSALPEKQRIAVHLFYFEDYPLKEIATIMDEKPSTVRSHIHRARATLKKQLRSSHA